MLALESDLKIVYKSQFCLTICHLVAKTVGNSNFQTTYLKILSTMKLVWALSIVLVCAFISQASEDRTNIQDASFLSILIMFLFILIQTSATHIERVFKYVHQLYEN